MTCFQGERSYGHAEEEEEQNRRFNVGGMLLLNKPLIQTRREDGRCKLWSSGRSQ
jgi:hypothetical protein